MPAAGRCYELPKGRGLSLILADVLDDVERLIDQGRYEDAVGSLAQFGPGGPLYPAARQLLIRCRFEQGRFGAAVEAARLTVFDALQADRRLGLWAAFIEVHAGDGTFSGCRMRSWTGWPLCVPECSSIRRRRRVSARWG